MLTLHWQRVHSVPCFIHDDPVKRTKLISSVQVLVISLRILLAWQGSSMHCGQHSPSRTMLNSQSASGHCKGQQSTSPCCGNKNKVKNERLIRWKGSKTNMKWHFWNRYISWALRSQYLMRWVTSHELVNLMGNVSFMAQLMDSCLKCGHWERGTLKVSDVRIYNKLTVPKINILPKMKCAILMV